MREQRCAVCQACERCERSGDDVCMRCRHIGPPDRDPACLACAQRCITCRHYSSRAGRPYCLARTDKVGSRAVGAGAAAAAADWRWDNWPAFRDGTPQDPPCPTYDHRPEGEEMRHDRS